MLLLLLCLGLNARLTHSLSIQPGLGAPSNISLHPGLGIPPSIRNSTLRVSGVQCEEPHEASDQPSRAVNLCVELLAGYIAYLPEKPLRWSTDKENASPELGALPFHIQRGQGDKFCLVNFESGDSEQPAKVDDTFGLEVVENAGVEIIHRCLQENQDGNEEIGPAKQVLMHIYGWGGDRVVQTQDLE
ncbi:uncharacterized protein KY384_005599 [Bacidia gigantensis]|uniref:uncharacterized protein n=1 Tax=Bacidia gigantensis TaxID=2732470 RepID=UPI001D0373D6|nr:uncharacterized protein KY384_005599 [Bacidia gigantensis]KAG8530117.1 hypothetical protein KY384_005599 [Bacidia gigantensis]